MIPTNAAIIHRPERVDRIPAIGKLLSAFPEARILPAKVPEWESDAHARAMRGCAVSHLSAVRAFLTPDSPLLVLEDDAVLIPDCDLADFPADAGFIVLGGDCDQYGDDYGSGYREVLPKFYGTHAVLYLPSLLRSGFLLNAFERMSTVRMGYNDICTESLLLLALGGTGLKAYRPNRMRFTTIPSASDSRGNLQPARNKAIEATERDGLMPPETWAEIFEPFAGKRVRLICPPGNPGDALIHAATRQLFRHYGLVETSESPDVVMYSGGGNIGLYGFDMPTQDLARSVAGDAGIPLIVLPGSWGEGGKFRDATAIYVRDKRSAEISGGILAHDLALAYRPSLARPPAQDRGEGIFFRTDAEKSIVPTDNILDPGTAYRTHYDYLLVAGSYPVVHTNRLHFAIAARIMGSRVILYPNSYHKNRGVWEQSLRDLGVEWANPGRDSRAQS